MYSPERFYVLLTMVRRPTVGEPDLIMPDEGISQPLPLMSLLIYILLTIIIGYPAPGGFQRIRVSTQ